MLEFIDRAFRNFFEGEFGVDIYDEKYALSGTSKANRLRSFIKEEGAYTVARVLRGLWDVRKSSPALRSLESGYAHQRRPFFDVINRIESASGAPRTDAIERFTLDETLDQLVSAIERDAAAGKPEAALDRLHTYCMKKFAHLLDLHNPTWDRNAPLNGRVGAYVKVLQTNFPLRDVSRQIRDPFRKVLHSIFIYVVGNMRLLHQGYRFSPCERYGNHAESIPFEGITLT